MPAATLGNTFGALEIGSCFAVFIFGIVTLQCYNYFVRYSDDRLVFKLLVVFIWCFELGHTIAIIFLVYSATITYANRLDQLEKFPAIGVLLILGGLITNLVQTFYSYRLYVVLPKPYNNLGLATAVTSFVRCVLSLYAGIKEISVPSYTQFVVQAEPVTYTLVCVGVVLDITIAVSLMYFLLARREKTFLRSKRLIDRLLGFTIRTGLITTVASLSVLITYITLPKTLIYLGIYMSLSKLYTNSLLSSLNNRKSLQDTQGNSFSTPRNGTHLHANNPITIEMKTVTQIQEDKISNPLIGGRSNVD